MTQYGSSILYHNNGDGTFSDVTAKAGVAAPGWGSSAVWFDYDNDGRLDLFVCRFVEFDKSANKFCGNEHTGDRYYCVPRCIHLLEAGSSTITATEHLPMSVKSRALLSVLGKAWGAVATDINNDGWLDLFVANDTAPNFLFVNKRGKFTDGAGIRRGIQSGRPRSIGNGVDAADYDQDGWQDLFVSNVDQEMYSIYRNNHDITFDDMAGPLGVGMTTRLMSGWGAKFFDYDNDETRSVHRQRPSRRQDRRTLTHVKYKEPLLLFHNDGKKF